MIDPTMPIEYDFGPHVAPVAKAAHDAYFAGRPALPWSDLNGSQTFRWLMLVDAKPWNGLKGDDKGRWRNVRTALLEARKEWRRTEPAVVPVIETPASAVGDGAIPTLIERLKARRQGVTQ